MSSTAEPRWIENLRHMISTAEPRWIEILRHMIGIDRDITLRGEPWRNHFVAHKLTDDDLSLQAMVEPGLVNRCSTSTMFADSHLYRATVLGIRLARNDERARRRAAGLRTWIVTVETEHGTDTHTVLARSRGAARWEIISDLLEIQCDLAWCFENVRVRVAEPMRRRRERAA